MLAHEGLVCRHQLDEDVLILLEDVFDQTGGVCDQLAGVVLVKGLLILKDFLGIHITEVLLKESHDSSITNLDVAHHSQHMGLDALPRVELPLGGSVQQMRGGTIREAVGNRIRDDPRRQADFSVGIGLPARQLPAVNHLGQQVHSR
jgi:hypothetical protein